MTHIAIVESSTAGRLLLEKALERGYRVSYLRSHRNDVFGSDGSEVPLGVNEYILDLGSAAELYDTCAKIQALQPLTTVLTTFEYMAEQVAEVNERLGLQGCSYSAVSLARDKYAAKQTLNQRQITDTKIGLALTLANLEDVAEKVGFPCVIKPQRGGGSLGAYVCYSQDELNNILPTLTDFKGLIPKGAESVVSPHFIVEQYLAGPMLSVEVAAVGGDTVVLAVGDRIRDSSNEVLEVGTMYPANLPSAQLKEASRFAQEVVQELGLDLGIFHVEVIFTESGPQLIECNPRLMGGSLPFLYSLAHERHIYELLLDVCVEQSLPIKTEACGIAASCLFGAVEDCILPEVDIHGVLERYQEYGLLVQWYKPLGSKVSKLRSNHDYVGAFRFVVAQGRYAQAIELRRSVLHELESLFGHRLVG